MANGFTKIINESFDSYVKRLTESAEPEEVVVGLYGDGVEGIRSVSELVQYFKSKKLKVSNVKGNMEHGWELDITGAPRAIFFAVQNLDIPGYASDSVSDFISEYRIDDRDDDFDESYRTHKRKSMREAAPKKASTDHKWGDKSVKSQLALPENQKKLNDMMKSGRNWKDMKNDFISLINGLDCTDKNKKQTIMKINGIKNEGAFYSTVATYLTGIKAESYLKEANRYDSENEKYIRRVLKDYDADDSTIKHAIAKDKRDRRTNRGARAEVDRRDSIAGHESKGRPAFKAMHKISRDLDLADIGPNGKPKFSSSTRDRILKKRNKELDEAVPKDLMNRIKDTDGYSLRGRTGYDWEKQEHTYPYDLDYANAESQEITAQDVMHMKRKGEDLSDIWVLIPGPKMWNGNQGKDQLIKLDRLGNPDLDFSTDSPRVNQALKTTLNKAKKIYKGDIRNVSETQPEKWTERTSDTDRRELNRILGHYRDRFGDHKDFHRRAERHNQEIAKARKEYENGDISRKEMEQRIASAKEARYRSKYDARSFNGYRQDQADARYYDSNATNKVPEFKRVKRDLVDAKNDLVRDQRALEKAKAGAGYENSYVTTKVEELRKKLASLQAELERYEQKLADNPQQKDIDDAQRRIDNTNQVIAQNQSTIDKLLRRK